MNLASETLKQYGEALKACDLALRYDPNNCEALVLKADIFYWKFMNKAEALKCFERIIQVNPKHDPAYIRQGMMFCEIKPSSSDMISSNTIWRKCAFSKRWS